MSVVSGGIEIESLSVVSTMTDSETDALIGDCRGLDGNKPRRGRSAIPDAIFWMNDSHDEQMGKSKLARALKNQVSSD